MGLAQREIMSLENLLENEFVELGINQENQQSIKNYLGVLKAKDQATYEHSVRVGLLCSKIAKHMHLDPIALFYSGVLHDIGKSLIPPETLKKTEGFNEQDMNLMKEHAEYSYKLLRGVHEFTAEIVVRHHRYQESGYPVVLPESGVNFSSNTKINIDFLARILALADFYDAITSRVNDWNVKICGEMRKLNSEESKKVMLDKNPDARYLIEDFYKNKIF